MANHLPLENVKICDFMWVMAGPASTRILADYGATVVRIESPTRIDTARTLQPYLDNKLGPDSSGLFANCNAGKFGISLDLANPKSREVVHDLVRWADVVTESFSPKAMRAWGFDYESLRKVNPKIIMLSSCLMGQSGPLAKIAGFGNMAAAIVGFHNLTGWPDRPPAGLFGAYTDYVAPRFTAMATPASSTTPAIAPSPVSWVASAPSTASHGQMRTSPVRTRPGTSSRRASPATRPRASRSRHPAARMLILIPLPERSPGRCR